MARTECLLRAGMGLQTVQLFLSVNIWAQGSVLALGLQLGLFPRSL